MKRCLLISILLGLGIINTYSQDSIVSIPDTAFQYALLNERVDTNGDSLISYEEAEKISKLDINNWNISDLTGLEAFIILGTLNCRDNQLISLDVSKNIALEVLSCGGNQLTNLDVSNNTALTRLECFNNQLTSLDVSNNTALTELSCSFNQLTNLDVSNCIVLTELWCSGNQLAKLNLCSNGSLWEVNIEDMPSLDTVYVWETPFPPANVVVYTQYSPKIVFIDCATGFTD